MHSFTAGGRTWEVTINVTQIRRVKGLTGVDLYTLVDDGAKVLTELLRDACKLVDVIYSLCKGQADEAKVSDEDFGRLMLGDVLDAAADAFVWELIDFFPSRTAEPLRRLMTKGKQVAERLTQQSQARIEAANVDEIADHLFASLTKSPVPSASTPDRSPSDPSS